MQSDIEIAQATKLKPIKEVAQSIGISEQYLEYYGNSKAKISLDIWDKLDQKNDGKLVLVTAMTPLQLEKVKLPLRLVWDRLCGALVRNQ